MERSLLSRKNLDQEHTVERTGKIATQASALSVKDNLKFLSLIIKLFDQKVVINGAIAALLGKMENKKRFKWEPFKPLIMRVENIGVEPTTSCMPCKRSSQLS